MSQVFIGGSGGSDPGVVKWLEVTGTSVNMSKDKGYIANNASLVTLTLPAIADIGSVVSVSGKGSGGWRIAQNAGQSIYYGNTTSTTGVGGYLESTHERDTVELLCVTANTEWQVQDNQGILNIV